MFIQKKGKVKAMKLKKVLAMLLTSAMVMSMNVGNVAFAAEQNTQVEAQQNTGGTEAGSEQSDVNLPSQSSQNSDGTVDKDTEDQSDKDADKSENTESVQKNDAETKTQASKEEDGIAVQAANTIYLNPRSGSDTANDGSTASKGVKTLSKALQLAGEGGTIYITESSLDITSSTTISGGVTIRRDSALSASNSMIMVTNGATLTLENATLDGASSGQLIYAQSGNLIINAGAKLHNSQAAAVRITNGTLTMNGGEIYNNQGRYMSDCGAVEVGRLLGDATFVMNGGKIYNNTSGGEAAPGAIHVDTDCTFTMNDGEIYGNTSADGAGGAIDSAGTVNIKGGTIHDNSASNGGAIHTFGSGVTTISGGTIRANSASNGGGAFNVSESGTLDITDGVITANTASWGGAINAFNHATVKLSGTGTITKNISEKNAGALCLEGGVNPADGNGSTFIMTGGSITDNVAGNGGDFGAGGAIVGYVWQGPADIQILGGTISGNTAMDEGAGIVLRGDAAYGVATLKLGGSPEIKDEVFLGNLADFPNTKAEVISAFTPKNPVPITDSGWLDNRVVVTYARGLAANVDDFTPADGADNSAIIKDGQDLQSINKLSVSFVEKGYIADGNHKLYKSFLILPKSLISKDEVPSIDNKPGYTVTEWKNSDTDKAWDFEKDTVTSSTHLYPVFQLKPATYELVADKDHIHGSTGDKVTLKTEFTAHEANNISYEWQWYKDDVLVSNGTSNDALEVTEPGTYKVIVTADDGSIHSAPVEKTITITKTEHDYGTADNWKYDETQHWKECAECHDRIESATHTFGDWTIEQTTRAAGQIKVRTCTVCGYEERVSVPTDPDVKKDISVNYTFVSGTENTELPSEVLALLPKDTNSYAAGDKVTAIQPEQTSVRVSAGVWNFEGYDADTKEAVSGMTFTGTWKFTPDSSQDDNKGDNNNNTGGKDNTDTSNGKDNTNANANSKSNVTSTTTVTKTVRTGDMSQTGTWSVVLMLSGIVTAIIAIFRRKKHI